MARKLLLQETGNYHFDFRGYKKKRLTCFRCDRIISQSNVFIQFSKIQSLIIRTRKYQALIDGFYSSFWMNVRESSPTF